MAKQLLSQPIETGLVTFQAMPSFGPIQVVTPTYEMVDQLRRAYETKTPQRLKITLNASLLGRAHGGQTNQ